MADKKISALTASTTPLAGTEVLPIVQSGATVKVAVSDLTAGRAVSATQVTLSTGNLVIGTADKGIDFSANTHAAGMTSELLNDYEEGAISIGATCDTGSITLSTNTLYYTKVGRMIHVTGKIVVDSVNSPTGNVYFGLPIVAGVSSAVTLYMSNTNTIAGKIPVGVINAGQTIFYIQTLDQVTGSIDGAASIFKAGTEFMFSASYI